MNEHALGDAVGLVLMGSFLTRKWKTNVTAAGRPQVAYPVPTLTVGAELDGLCRVTRVAEALYSQVTFAEDPAAAVRSLPVTVVAGMNHYQFATGSNPPLFVKQNDLTPEIDEAAAHAQVNPPCEAVCAPHTYPPTRGPKLTHANHHASTTPPPD